MRDRQRLSRAVRRRAGEVRRIARRNQSDSPEEPEDRGPGDPPGGVPRDASIVETHVGPVFDAGVARVRARMLPAGIDPDYDLAYEHFDLPGFLLQAPRFLVPGRDPLRHFLDRGAEAAAVPEAGFDTAAYLARRSTRPADPTRSPYLEWLSEGRPAALGDPAPGLDELAPALGLNVEQAAAELERLRLDLQNRLRTGELGRMLACAAELEPLVEDAWPATMRPTIPPFRSREEAGSVAAIHAVQARAGFARARLLLVCGGPRWGGGARMEGHLARTLRGEVDPRDVVVLYTDTGGRAPEGRFPSGVREVDLAACVGALPPDAAQRVLVEVVRSFRADAVVNVNSMLFHQALPRHGRALGATERVFLVMFGNEQTPLGSWVGIPLRFFHRSFELVAGVVVDSHHLADWLTERHQLSDRMRERVHVLSAPMDLAIPLAAVPTPGVGRRPQVFWAGRFDRQKRVDLALAVARLLPEVDLRMWGEAVLSAPDLESVPDNVTLEGTYGRLGDIGLDEADAWLYTSAWDGVPGQLLEVTMTGIPVVGTLVGGTSEVLLEGLSWPVDAAAGPESYAAALREVLADPDDARRRAHELRDRLIEVRSEAAYAERAARVLLGPRRSAGQGAP